MLNENQKLAAHSLKPAIVTAGPGSGKTKTLTERVAYLLGEGVSPTEILCFTFTRSAAKEMKERLSSRFDTGHLTITTIHAFCLNLVRMNHHIAGFRPNVVIYDDTDSKDMKKIISEENKWKYNQNNEKKSPDFEQIDKEYKRLLRVYNAINFDQMEYKASKLLDKKDLDYVKRRYRYVLVDEMQDVSRADVDIILKVSEFHRNVFCCGDIDQAIYMFRGSDPKLIKEIEEHVEDGYHVDLNTSYRCSQPILDLCNLLAGTKLVSNNDIKTQPMFVEEDTPEDEAAFIAQMIMTLKSESVGLLCRTNKMINFFHGFLSDMGIEHHVVGQNAKMMDDPSIRLTNSFIKFWYNNNDYLNFRKVMPILFDNITTNELRRIRSESIIESTSLLETAKNTGYDMSMFMDNGIDTLNRCIDILYDWHRKKKMTTKADTVESYRDFVHQWFAQNHGTDMEDYVYYMSDVNVSEDSHQEVEKHAVNLLTIHSSKGLEFDTVFIPGMTKAFRSNDISVAFVAMSRAKRNLIMSYSRTIYRGDYLVEARPSSILGRIGLIQGE